MELIWKMKIKRNSGELMEKILDYNFLKLEEIYQIKNLLIDLQMLVIELKLRKM